MCSRDSPPSNRKPEVPGECCAGGLERCGNISGDLKTKTQQMSPTLKTGDSPHNKVKDNKSLFKIAMASFYIIVMFFSVYIQQLVYEDCDQSYGSTSIISFYETKY